jgi:hypothetical protein
MVCIDGDLMKSFCHSEMLLNRLKVMLKSSDSMAKKLSLNLPLWSMWGFA